jgi:hypothetical protein
MIPEWSRKEMTDRGKSRAQELLGDTAFTRPPITTDLLRRIYP